MECPQVFCVWVLVVVSQLWLYGCFGCYEKERSALLELKFSINNPNGTSLPSWKAGADCCSWYEVRCDSNTGRVVELNLQSTRDAGLGWYMNASLLLPFEELRSLDLHGNLLEGFIDEEELTRLRNLETLDLGSNNLMGPIPPSIGSLTSLKSLSLAYNRYNDSQSIQELTRLRNLETLDLGSNNLMGPIPPSIGSLTSLKSLSLAYNRYNDSQSIQVAHNNLSGKIPYVKQFATFDESSYDGNPLLCGSPLNKSCTIQDPKGEEDDDDDDGDDDDDNLVTFYAAFVGSYSVFLLGTIAFLYFTSQRRAVCFLHVIDSWCGFLLYKICMLFNCK